MIKFDKISYIINSQKILDNINLEICGGEFLALVGSSGAGKSTLLKLLIGEYKPSKGHVIVDDVDISTLNKKYLQLYRRKLGVVFQDYKLLPKKTVAENIAFALEVCEESNSKIQQTIPEIMRLVNLNGKENHFPHQLSGGEQQRVAIARALAHKPALLIADEPTGNLDKKNAAEIIDILSRINKQGVTVIITTHQPELLRALKNIRLEQIENGKIL
ncbi:MAG: ATP-binding cassette domain-containing protein [Patescibacteria group bacterium]|nr:ATP-binding cassette domain-containing protein [Patescibacteria group bacterium]